MFIATWWQDFIITANKILGPLQIRPQLSEFADSCSLLQLLSFQLSIRFFFSIKTKMYADDFDDVSLMFIMLQLFT